MKLKALREFSAAFSGETVTAKAEAEFEASGYAATRLVSMGLAERVEDEAAPAEKAAPKPKAKASSRKKAV